MYPQKKKVLFLISCFSHGRGGHFYSLLHIVTGLSTHIDPIIVSIGPGVSPVLEASDRYHTIVVQDFTASSIRIVIKQLQNFSFDVIHSFDGTALFFARLLSFRSRKVLVHTKCGGPSPRYFFPKVHNLLVFSGEDYSFFTSNKRFSETSINIIPNRVSKTLLGPQEHVSFRDFPEQVIVLRICRIGAFHKHSLYSALSLCGNLVEQGCAAKLVVIGTVESKEVLSDFLAAAKEFEHCEVLTDHSFTLNASRFIGSADIVIGTGRSLMEAAIQGKIIACPTKRDPYYTYVNPGNINSLLHSNFSDRAELSDNQVTLYPGHNGDQAINAEEIINNTPVFIHKEVLEHIDVAIVAEKYCKIYESCSYRSAFGVDLFIHFLQIKKTFFRMKKKYNL